MNEILMNTRKNSNIELLRARDFWFNKARRWGWAATVISMVPIVFTAISYLPIPDFIDYFDETRDILIGIAALVLFLICIPIERRSNRLRSVSNEFRELYDVQVLGIPRNPFLLPEKLSEKEEQMLEEGARRYRDHQKYEAWYEEVFSDNHHANVICCQMDNAIYTYYVYRDAVRFYWGCTFALLLLVILPALIFQSIEALILILVSSFAILTECLQSIREIHGQLDTLSDMHDIAKTEEIDLDDDEACTLFIRETQDAIAGYRDASVFVPRFIRLKYLQEDSPYYADLNDLKARLYKGLEVTRPETASQIVVFDETETTTCTLEDVQDTLRGMLRDMVAAFNAEGIGYTLDGGTLIGAMRANENGHFVFWDDDVDVVLPVDRLEDAKRAIMERYGDKYAVQDYGNDPAYSPRLSNFRIRHKGSVTSEKDSLLYENYRERGIFIDVYAYSPILVCRWIDAAFRRMLLHPLNRRILRAENRAVRNASAAERPASPGFQRFLRLKEKYLKRIDWYLAHAKNDDFVAYVPTYVFDLKNAGPYIAKGQMEPAQDEVTFEGIECTIPADHDAVLRAYYGDWSKVPFRTIEQMKAVAAEKGDADGWYSEFVQAITPLKHLRNVELDQLADRHPRA